MSIENWTLFIQERLRAYDPQIDLAVGSPASVQVVEPIVNRLSPDPIDTDAFTFILTRLQQEYPELYAKEGSALADLFVKPNLILLEPFKREIRSVRNQKSLQDQSLLTSAEADALISNFFITRSLGDYARVRVRAYFQNPLSVNIGSTNIAFTAQGLRFLPSEPQSITAEAMLFNKDGNLYYFDIDYVSERPGTAYNIQSSEIIGIIGLSSATRATNIYKANPGSNEESTSDLIAKTEQSIGERSLTNNSGIVHKLYESFPNLKNLQVIGFNDSEMGRDVIVGGSLGPILFHGDDGTTVDDGDGDGETTLFNVVSSIDFTEQFGPVGKDISDYCLTIFYSSGPIDYALDQVMGSTQVRIKEYAAISIIPLNWTIRKKDIITLSDIPGGILFPDTNGTVLTVPSNEVHVGNCTDFYVRGSYIENKSIAISIIADQYTIARKEDARTTNGDPWIVLNDLSEEEYSDITENRSSIVLETGSDAGSYKIIEKAESPYQVRVVSDMTSPGVTTDISYIIVDDIDIDLLEPKEIKYEGTDLKTVAGVPTVTTVGGSPDFNAVGVVDTDLVKIVEEDGVTRTYEINSGGVTASEITLKNNMLVTASPLHYTIFRKQTGIELPLLRVTGIERLDSSMAPTGEMIPYRIPIEVISRNFQNPGRGAKAGTSVETTSDTLSRDTIEHDVAISSNISVNYFALGVRQGDILNINSSDNQGFYTITEVGGDPLSTLGTNEFRTSEEFRWPETEMEYELGAPSYGSFRILFLNPCTFEVDYENTIISVEINGVKINFRPDPEIYDEFLPTSSTVPIFRLEDSSGLVIPYGIDGVTNIDLLNYGLEVGDRVEITRYPIIGSADLAAGGINLNGKTIKIDVGYGTQIITFVGTSLGINEIISQMNSQLYREVVSSYEDGAEKHLMLRGDHEIYLENNSSSANDGTLLIFGTNRNDYQPWLTGSFVGVDTSNDAPDDHGGYFIVGSISSFPTGGITLTNTDGTAWLSDYDIPSSRGPYVHIQRAGRQKISSTEMAVNKDTLGFYYFDVECISEGYGDLWNINAEIQGEIVLYYSEGWSIETDNTNTSYSMAEEPWLVISPRILIVGNDDDPANYRELSGDNIQVSYEQDSLVHNIHDFVRDTQVRDVCQNPLVKSLYPVFVRTSITYTGGDTEKNVRSLLANLITSIRAEDELKVSAITQLILKTGSSKIKMPITLVGVTHREDRTINVERSEDALYINRLTTLIPDADPALKESDSYIILNRIV
jgi:hypothetical protein